MFLFCITEGNQNNSDLNSESGFTSSEDSSDEGMLTVAFKIYFVVKLVNDFFPKMTTHLGIYHVE